MSDRTDRKLQEVEVARYHFRHEAEFAAGFLDDADIPHRLQVDDAAMGFTIGSPAIIWVREMDLRRARETLEISGDKVTLSGRVAAQRSAGPGRARVVDLTVRERLLAVAGSLGGIGIVNVYVDGGSDPTLARLVVIIAGAFLVAAAFGRAPRPIKNFLGTLSGNAP